MKRIEQLRLNNYGYLLNNFRSDQILQKEQKKKFNSFFCFLNHDSILSINELRDEINRTFFYNEDYQQLGEQVLINKNEEFGHVVEKEYFFKEFNRIINKEEKNISLFSIVNPALRKSFEEGLLKRIKAKYGKYFLRLRQMFSFRNPSYKGMLEGIKKEELSSLLALDDLTLPKFLFCHKDCKVKKYKPTAFDAGFNSYWNYGGFTKPIGSCKGKQGLEELVHNAIVFNCIISIILLPK